MSKVSKVPLPRLPQEIWDIIYKIKHELEEYDKQNWIKMGQNKRWNEMSLMNKILWKLGLADEPKLRYKKPVPTWEQVLTPYVS